MKIIMLNFSSIAPKNDVIQGQYSKRAILEGQYSKRAILEGQYSRFNAPEKSAQNDAKSEKALFFHNNTQKTKKGHFCNNFPRQIDVLGCTMLPLLRQ